MRRLLHSTQPRRDLRCDFRGFERPVFLLLVEAISFWLRDEPISFEVGLFRLELVGNACIYKRRARGELGH